MRMHDYIYHNYSYIHAGTHDLLATNPSLLSKGLNHDAKLTTETTQCRKDTGKAKRLWRWSRGHQFIVRAGGHIEAWQPIYK